MPENAEKKRYIKDFLQKVKSGTGFIDYIRIERFIRQPGSDGEGSTARSLSGRQIANITQLLEDDLRHTFAEGFFTFRFVAALLSSGKTSLLTYLSELTKTKSTYKNNSVFVQLQVSEITLGDGFFGKFYCHFLLYDTLWQLLHYQNLSDSVRGISEKFLIDFFESYQIAQLTSAKTLMPFRNKCKKYIFEIDGLEKFFFYVISEVSAVEPKFSFVYLVNELDALARFTTEIQETRLLFKQLMVVVNM